MKTYSERTQNILERIAITLYKKQRKKKIVIKVGIVYIVLAMVLMVSAVIPQIEKAREWAREAAIPTVLSNDSYDIKKNGDELYLNFYKDYYGGTSSRPSGSMQGATPSTYTTIYFESVAEMKERIETGDFSDAQLAKIQNFKKASNGKVAILDTNNLYDFIPPEGIVIKQVFWTGLHYSISFCPDFSAMKYGGFGSISLTTKEKCEEKTSKAELKAEGNDEITILSESVDPQTNGKVICYEDRKGTWKQIVYTHTDGENTVTVQELYWEEKGFEVPSNISFWGNCGERYFSGNIDSLRERPDYEWITSFGLVPYVEKEGA